MKKKILVFSLLVVILLSFTCYASEQETKTWETSSSKDEMTGEESWHASSPAVEPTEKMDFPYGNIKAWLGIGYDGKNEWVYIGFNESPNLTDATTEDGYDLIRTRVKWDEDKMHKTKLTQDWGSKFLQFEDDDLIISRIAKYNVVLLELDWYGEGEVYFRFPLDGSADAIEKIHNAFDE